MTYGELRLFLKKLAPTIDQELIDGWISDVYTEILDAVPWKRTESESVIQVGDSYITGTVALTRGSTTVTGTSTVWAATMDGRMLRIGSENSYYQFTYVSTTSGTLDREYEGVDVTGASYRMDEARFLLPTDCRVVQGVRPLDGRKNLELLSPMELNRKFPNRNSYGDAVWYSPTWDTASDPPIMQLEFGPVPQAPGSGGTTPAFVVAYIYDPDPSPADTSTSLLPWTRPAAIKAGVRAEMLAHEKDLGGAAYYRGRFKELLQQMAVINAQQRGPQKIQLAKQWRRRAPGDFLNRTRGPRNDDFEDS